MSVNEKMTAIADAIRGKTGGTEMLTLDAMTAAIAGIEAGGGGDYTNEQMVEIVERKIAELVVPSGTTFIPVSFQDGNTALQKLALPEGLTEIQLNAFRACTALIECALPQSLTALGNFCFQNCPKWDLAKLPENLEIIGYSALFGCTGMSITTIPASVTTLGPNAFSGRCSKVTSLTFMGTPTSIDATALSFQQSLDIYVPWAEGEVANAPWGATKATIHYNSTGG